MQQIKRDNPEFIVISDWRYKEEHEHLKFVFPEAEIIKVRIQRDSISIDKDQSEHELDNEKFNFSIKNNGSLEDLNRECYKLLNSV